MLKNLKKRLKDQRGLTLVELLAVIVILGIIAAIAVPSIGNIIAKSKFDASKADALQVLNAANLYMTETGETKKDDLGKDALSTYINGDDIVNLKEGWTVDIVDGVPKISATASHPQKGGSDKVWSNATTKDVNGTKFDEAKPDDTKPDAG
ncbi:type II secretion system protein [Cytobacillus praedii]|uniref:type IV pilin protein n=1 Tax=Cytobacillus praedii TaxID=1742358 RepID=UPI002E2371E7|nr:type II secretion system protein [Cytobacillus praedii]